MNVKQKVLGIFRKNHKVEPAKITYKGEKKVHLLRDSRETCKL